MSRITSAILDQRAFGIGTTQPMVDLTYGGQNGWSPNLVEWASNQGYVRRNLQCVLLEAPRFFTLMPDPQKWVSTLKSLMELHVKTIDGFNAGLTVEFDEHAVGGGGEFQQEITDVKRARSEPSFGFVEKAGMPIATFFEHWIRYGMMDPDTKYAMIGTLAGERPDDMLPDWFTMSCLFYEPDPSHRKIIKSWVTTNMMPRGNGDNIGKRDLTAASEVSNITIDMTGISQFNLGTNLFAQRILDTINLNNANPYLRPSFIQDISSDVNAAEEGIIKNITDLGASAVPGIR